jgi:DNA-binding transcriptional regulator PaaX
MSQRWTLVIYHAPSQPSSARVAAWRQFNRLGALYLGPTTCLIPDRLDPDRTLTSIAERLVSAGGSFEAHVIDAFSAETRAAVEQRYNAARDAEYNEVVERAQGLVDELEAEGAKGKFTYAEVEENEVDLIKLRRWLRRIIWRDLYGAARRGEAQAAVERAASRLDDFTERSLPVQADENDIA